MKTPKICAVAIAVVGIALAGCGSSGGSSSSSGSGGNSGNFASGATLNVGIDSDWQNFNVQTVDDAITQDILQNAYATLLAQTPSGKLIPYIASSWKATPTSITFSLKKGVTCSDGTPVTPTV